MTVNTSICGANTIVYCENFENSQTVSALPDTLQRCCCVSIEIIMILNVNLEIITAEQNNSVHRNEDIHWMRET